MEKAQAVREHGAGSRSGVEAMRSRLQDIPAFQVSLAVVEAEHYNRVRLALSRLQSPLRLCLPSLRGLDILLDDEAWVCVDRTMEDLPVVAWTDFENTTRAGLHQPVRCQLRLFHAHAGMILNTVFADVEAILTERLAEQDHHGPGDVSDIRNRTDKS